MLFIRDKGKKRDAFTTKDPNGILINAVIINQGDMSKEYLDLKFIYHYDESLPNKIPLKIIAPNHLLETNLQASKENSMKKDELVMIKAQQRRK